MAESTMPPRRHLIPQISFRFAEFYPYYLSETRPTLTSRGCTNWQPSWLSILATVLLTQSCGGAATTRAPVWPLPGRSTSFSKKNRTRHPSIPALQLYGRLGDAQGTL